MRILYDMRKTIYIPDALVNDGTWSRIKESAHLEGRSVSNYLIRLYTHPRDLRTIKLLRTKKAQDLMEAGPKPAVFAGPGGEVVPEKPEKAKKVSKASSGETLSVAEKKAVVEGLRSNPVFNAIPKKKG